jgi:EmrB/QacA subfamily drug resistance transporter
MTEPTLTETTPSEPTPSEPTPSERALAELPTDRAVDSRGQARHPALALTLVVACYLMVGIDSSIVNIALPSIGGNLGFSRTALSWVINAYLITSGGLLLLGGRAGDVFGRRRMLITGVALFTGASALAGLAGSPGWLLAARAVQGIGGALSTPGTLALIATAFPVGAERNRALSIYSAAAGAGASLGLVIGGALTGWGSWRWVFFITVPIGAVVMLFAGRVIPEPPRHPGRLDITGAIVSTAGMASLVYAFIRAGSDGWRDGRTVAAFAVAVVLIALFVALERRHPSPLLPLSLLADRDRAFAYLNVALLPATMLGTFYFLTQYFQNVLGFAPVQAGLAFLPLTLPMFAVVRIVPRLLARTGTRPLMIAGAALVTIAVGWLSRLTTDSGYLGGVLVPLLICGVGIGLSFMPLNVTILSRVAPTDSGAASGLLQTLQWTGSSLGLAILTTTFAHGSGATGRSAELVKPSAAMLVDGFTAAFTVATGFALLALLVAVFGLRPASSPARDGAGSGRNAAR